MPATPITPRFGRRARHALAVSLVAAAGVAGLFATSSDPNSDTTHAGLIRGGGPTAA